VQGIQLTKADGLTYGEFMRKVDSVLIHLVGIGHEDLDDLTCTREMFDAGATPDQVAAEILLDNECPLEDDDYPEDEE
jgi:hypothetical protein